MGGWGGTINKGKNPGGWEEGFYHVGNKKTETSEDLPFPNTHVHISTHTHKSIQNTSMIS